LSRAAEQAAGTEAPNRRVYGDRPARGRVRLHGEREVDVEVGCRAVRFSIERPSFF
jgi:hypothetical protein